MRSPRCKPVHFKLMWAVLTVSYIGPEIVTPQATRPTLAPSLPLTTATHNMLLTCVFSCLSRRTHLLYAFKDSYQIPPMNLLITQRALRKCPATDSNLRLIIRQSIRTGAQLIPSPYRSSSLVRSGGAYTLVKGMTPRQPPRQKCSQTDHWT